MDVTSTTFLFPSRLIVRKETPNYCIASWDCSLTQHVSMDILYLHKHPLVEHDVLVKIENMETPYHSRISISSSTLVFLQSAWKRSCSFGSKLPWFFSINHGVRGRVREENFFWKIKMFLFILSWEKCFSSCHKRGTKKEIPSPHEESHFKGTDSALRF